MNKNTTILLGAIAVIAIGIGVYLALTSTSYNESYETQSERNITQPTTTVPVEYWGDKNKAGKDG